MGFLLLALPSVIFVVAPLFFVLIAVAQWFMGRRLEGRGVVVPATVLDASGNRARFEEAGEAWSSETDALSRVSDDDVGTSFEFAGRLSQEIGRLVPAVIVHYAFPWNGRRYRVGKYMFSSERFRRDENGRLWALVDPRYPRLNHWLVSSLPP